MFDFIASTPFSLLLLAYSFIIIKGLPYSSNAKLISKKRKY
jgi:hypothetical protein